MSVLANPYGSYIEEELHYSKNFETIKNIFAPTTSRQRSTPMDDQIVRLQQQYNDDLSEEAYAEEMSSLLEEFKDIFEVDSNEAARIPKIHVDLKPKYKDKRFLDQNPYAAKRINKPLMTITKN